MRAATVLVVLAVLVAAAAAVPQPGYSRLLKAAQRLEETADKSGRVKKAQNSTIVPVVGSTATVQKTPVKQRSASVAGWRKSKRLMEKAKKDKAEAANELAKKTGGVHVREVSMAYCVDVPADTRCCNIAGSSKVKALSSWKRGYEKWCGSRALEVGCSGGKRCTPQGWLYQCPMNDPENAKRQHDEVAALGGHVFCEFPNGVAYPLIVPLSSKLNAGKNKKNCKINGKHYNKDDYLHGRTVDFSNGFTTFHDLVGLHLLDKEVYEY